MKLKKNTVKVSRKIQKMMGFNQHL